MTRPHAAPDIDDLDELRYRPAPTAWGDPVQPSADDIVLYSDDRSVAVFPVARHAVALRAVVPMGFGDVPGGLYEFRDTDDRRYWLVVVDSATSIEAARERPQSIEDDHFLMRAFALFSALLPNAIPASAWAKYSVGDAVSLVSSEGLWRVVSWSYEDGEFFYRLESTEGKKKNAFEDSLTPVRADPSDPEYWIARGPADARKTALALTLAKLRVPLTDTVYSFQSSKTLFRSYQFRPVMRIVNSTRQRILIADEVGLGKTIEAGLIWNELEQRMLLTHDPLRGTSQWRTLVVCPSSLVDKWRSEMRNRFDRDLKILDGRGLEELAGMIRRDESGPFAGVVSLERLRRDETLENLDPRFDLIIVDEAHYLRNTGTRSFRLGQRLAQWADALVFLSATPLNLGTQDLFNLVSLLADDEFTDADSFERSLAPNRHLNEVARRLTADRGADPRGVLPVLDKVKSEAAGRGVAARPVFRQLRELLQQAEPLSAAQVVRAKSHIAELNTLAGILTRTRKREVTDAKAERVAHSVEVHWTDEELRFYQELEELCRQRAKESGTASNFAAQMWLRQAASCIPAMQRLLRDRGHVRLHDDLDDFDEELLDDGGDLATAAAQSAMEQAIGGIRRSALASPVQEDTKFEEFVAYLRQARAQNGRQSMVFSFFRRTLDYLAQRLAPEFSVRVMHGGVRPEERRDIMRDFRAGAFEVLLCSEVGSEGLDFEFCNVLFNYDLPWNPMRVEQRIGRLDRFGQQSDKIFIFNMQVPGTIETDIFQRLYDRIGVFENSIGDLEPILRSELGRIQRIVLDPTLTRDEINRRLEQIDLAREARKMYDQELKEHEGQLAGLDGLLIEGFEDSSPGRGRYLGAGEIRLLLEEFFRETDCGRLEDGPTGSGIVRVIGTKDLVTQIEHAVRAGYAAKGPLPIRPSLRRGSPVDAAFSAQVATRDDVDLLSIRHHLVQTAHWYFAQGPGEVPAYGRIRIPGIPPGSVHLVVVYRASSTGLRQRQELWPIAVDARTGREAVGVGAALLTELANGSWSEPEDRTVPDVASLLNAADALLAKRQRAETADQRADNAALVETRRAAQRQSFELKIQRARDEIHEERRRNYSDSVLRMRVANAEKRMAALEQRRDAVLADLEAKLAFGLDTEQVAMVLVYGT